MRMRASASSSTTSARTPARLGSSMLLTSTSLNVGRSSRPASSLRITEIGNATMNVAPCPSPGLFTRTEPPCNSTRCLTMDRPSPRPPWRRVRRRVGLAEAVEHEGQEFGLDADAGILDRHFDVRVHALEHHVDVSAGRRELHRIGQQVPEHLLQPAGVAAQPTRARIERDAQPQLASLRSTGLTASSAALMTSPRSSG